MTSPKELAESARTDEKKFDIRPEYERIAIEFSEQIDSPKVPDAVNSLTNDSKFQTCHSLTRDKNKDISGEESTFTKA